MTSLDLRSTSPEDLESALRGDSMDSLQLPPLRWVFNEEDLHPGDEFLPSELEIMSPGSADDRTYIDLTRDSSPSSLPRPEASSSRSDQEPARKRRRIIDDREERNATSASASVSRPNTQTELDVASLFGEDDLEDVEELDLTRVENDADLERHEEERAQRKVEEQQRQLLNETIVSQNPSQASVSKLSQLSCIICMETMTDLTATHCGHIFCHTCIMEALIAGENQGGEPGKGRSRCPVCRKNVLRNPKGRDAAPQAIPLELKLSRRSDKAKGKQREDVKYDDPPVGD